MKQPYEFTIYDSEIKFMNPVNCTYEVQLKICAVMPKENVSEFKNGRVVHLFTDPYLHTKEILNAYFGKDGYNQYIAQVRNGDPVVKKAIYNNPATIILWDDGTKTVVKCSEREDYDPEKGFAMCYLKKLLGEIEYKKIFKKHVKPYEKEEILEDIDISKLLVLSNIF